MMFYNHILLETYCMNEKKCPNGFKQIRIECIRSGCEFCGYTECPAEIAVTDINGIASHWIALSGDDAHKKKKLKKWQKICIKKLIKHIKIISGKNNFIFKTINVTEIC
ncbi:MAG: hypothetical protein K2I06_12850, partial [Ruminococcus sp.]|nr:hypothetical protein [Ruminococcus sp.]